MEKKLLVLVVAGMLVWGMGFDAITEEFASSGEVTEEELLFREIPIVVTAAKKEQPITEAPATVFVITSEDIKQSGVTNIPDVLRMAPGVDVMTITARDQQVGIRGFNTPVSNKLLVLIDGRSVYWDALGNVLWNAFPVGLEDIERIEIVRGPSSSLYGANAYCGVINIITKSPEQIKGTKLTITGGNYSTLIGSVLHGYAGEKIDYRLSAEYDTANEWRDKDKNAGEITKGNAFVEYKIGEKNKLSLSAGRNHSKDIKIFASEAAGTRKVTGNFDYLQFDYSYSDIKFRTFLKREDAESTRLRTGIKEKWLTATYDTELQHSLNIGEKNVFIWGGSYRYNTVDKNLIIPDNYTQDLLALFAENEFKFTDKLKLTLGSRYDWHPLVKEHFSPRGAISFTPVKKHIIRVSAGKAFRNPAFINSYIYSEQPMTTTLPSPFPPINVPYTYIIQGNKDLKSEGITSYELGYRSEWLKKIVSNLSVFYNEYTAFFVLKRNITYYGAGELGFPHPGGVIPKRVVNTFENGEDAWGIGGEIDLDIFITDYLSGIANYSYQQITDKEDDLTTTSVVEKDRVRPEYPKNKANVGFRLKLKSGISANLLAHWVDKTKRLINDVKGNEYLAELNDYTIFNIRVGYLFLDKKAAVSLSVYNLFNDKHYEYPVGINLPDYSSDEIGRKITGKLSYRF